MVPPTRRINEPNMVSGLILPWIYLKIKRQYKDISL
jgi:hypothetical protein